MILEMPAQQLLRELHAFGMGGALLQKVNRDTFSFAQKASWGVVDGTPRAICKRPQADPGKASKAGRIASHRRRADGAWCTAVEGTLADADWQPMLELVWRDGTLQAVHARLVYDTGAYAHLGAEVMALGMEHAGGPYRIPHVLIEGQCVYTNNPDAQRFYERFGFEKVGQQQFMTGNVPFTDWIMRKPL